jgi:hypothetical protein
LGTLQEGSHNVGLDLDVDARVFQDPLQSHVSAQQRLMLLELLPDLRDHIIALSEL